jgi:hypothetical protein
MRFICFICLLFAIPCSGQNLPDTTKGIGTMDAYEFALKSFLNEHMDLVYPIAAPPGRIVILRQKPFTTGFPPTVNGIKVLFFDPAVPADMDSLTFYMHKKQKLNILDLQQMILRETQGQIWIMPMKAAFDPKKRFIDEPEFKGIDCEYIFDYHLGNQASFIYKTSVCKEL